MSPFRPTLALALSMAALLSPLASAATEIYRWTDAQGQTHIGDKVPAAYQSAAVRVTPQTPEPSATERASAQRQAAAVEAQAASGLPPSAQVPTPAPAPPQVPSGAQTCAQKRQTYQQSQACYSRFLIVNGALKPGAAQACGPALVDPAATCGP